MKEIRSLGENFLLEATYMELSQLHEMDVKLMSLFLNVRGPCGIQKVVG